MPFIILLGIPMYIQMAHTVRCEILECKLPTIIPQHILYITNMHLLVNIFV